jgi:mannitol-1-phosphate/altronate dehydrogenase
MVPAIQDGLKAGLDMKGLAFTIACWGHYIETEIDEGGELSDPRGEGVRKVVESGGVEELLACEEVFKDLASNDEWKETVMSCYKGIKENGVDATIQSMFPSDKKGAEKKEEATAAA